MVSARATPGGGRRRLSRALVVETARDLLDEQGLEGFSMSRLGERLGVTGMAIYRYVADRAELEEAVAELVLDDLQYGLTAADSWPDAIGVWMHRVRDHWRLHPWLGHFLGSRTRLSTPWLAALERLATILETAGLPPDVVARELVRISRATAGLVVQENAAPLDGALQARIPLAGLSAADQERWRSLVTVLEHYTDDDLFADLVTETVDRVRAQLR
jgi:AcrR family transcriptional regulator